MKDCGITTSVHKIRFREGVKKLQAQNQGNTANDKVNGNMTAKLSQSMDLLASKLDKINANQQNDNKQNDEEFKKTVDEAVKRELINMEGDDPKCLWCLVILSLILAPIGWIAMICCYRCGYNLGPRKKLACKVLFVVTLLSNIVAFLIAVMEYNIDANKQDL